MEKQEQEVKPFLVSAVPNGIKYSVNIDEEFFDTKQFDQVVSVLEEANENDFVILNVSTIGGAINAVLPLLGAMANAKCHVHAHACSDVASAGTLILLRADTISINEFVTIMCHQIQFGSIGPSNNVGHHVKHTMRLGDRLLREIYYGFFSDEEIEKMLNGTDFYMDDLEFIQRCEKRAEILSAQISAEQAPEQQDLDLE